MENKLNDLHIKKFVERNYDKLQVLIFIDKQIDYSKILNTFNLYCSTNTIYTYLVIDITNFEGKSSYLNTLQRIPQYDVYFFNNKLHSFFEIDLNDINEILFNVYKKIQDVYKQQMINIEIVKRKIIEVAKNKDPAYYKSLMQDPDLLQSITNTNVFNAHQNQLNQQYNVKEEYIPKIEGSVAPVSFLSKKEIEHPNKPTFNLSPELFNFKNESMGVEQPLMAKQIEKINDSTLSHMSAQNILDSQSCLLNNELIPTLQQLKYMFKIFTMMQQMGILDIPTKNENNKQNDNEINEEINNESTITLQNGDKLVKLADGKYGLIKNT